MSQFLAPCPLKQEHQLSQFNCGVSALDHWLKHKALANERSRATRTYVLSTKDRKVIGYYALAAASIAAIEVPRKIKRNIPDPIPVMVLGRLAIDLKFRSKRLGDALLRDAILRIIQTSEIVGVKAILVHAISEQAKQFYLDRSFITSPINPMTLLLPIESLIKT